ncbi:MAG: thioredoxin fold domain-containing protein [Actinomycetota bacterium]
MTTTSPPSSSNRLFIGAVAAIVVIGLALVAVVASSGGDDVETAAEQTAAVELQGNALSPLPDGVNLGTADTDPMVGTQAPVLTALDFAGNEVTIDADGRPKAVYFLAHWCPHCQEEVKVVQQLIDDGQLPDGLDLYAVSTAVDQGAGNYPPEAWLIDEGFEPTTVRDDEASTAFQAFGGSGFPYVVSLDGDHNVLARTAGGLDAATMAAFWGNTAAG